MSIYMKLFAVLIICGSSVAMVAAAPPAQTVGSNVAPQPDITRSAIVFDEVAVNANLVQDEVLPLSCSSQSLTDISFDNIAITRKVEILGELSPAVVKMHDESTRAQLEQRVRAGMQDDLLNRIY
ncbi:MAG: hypothetical protein ABJG88_07635 [Litorimonas sp.]